MRVWVKLWVGLLGAIPSNSLKRMAGTTGLEPAASAVTGQRSNQLNYVPNLFIFIYLPSHAKLAQDSVAVNSVAYLHCFNAIRLSLGSTIPKSTGKNPPNA